MRRAGSDPKLIAKPEAADFAAADRRASRSAACWRAATSSSPCGRSRASTTASSTRRAPSIRSSDKVARDAAGVSAVFTNFESHRRNIELGFASVFVMLSLTMLISAVWMGLTFANQLVGPIRRLIRATDEVASGNLYVQVPTRRSEGDLGHLGETFNKMTLELRQQRNRLTAANALNDERRAFIEAVLSGVPAGVIGVDRDGVVTVSNAAADRLLSAGDEAHGLVGAPHRRGLSRRLAPILAEARVDEAQRLHQGQATLQRHGRERLLNVRVTGDPQRGDQGSVITLDDISDLVTRAAQRRLGRRRAPHRP